MAKQKPKTSKPVIVFDFDGTIADTFVVALNIYYDLAHHKPMPEEDITRLRGMNGMTLMRALNIHPWQLPFWGWRIRRKLAQKINTVELIPGIKAAISQLSSNHQLIIFTSNTAANVEAILERYEMTDYFAGVYGNAGILRKEHALRRLLSRRRLEPGTVWYVGDETRDVEAAHRAGVRCIAVSWGFNTIGALEHHRPDALVFSPEELVDFFKRKDQRVNRESL